MCFRFLSEAEKTPFIDSPVQTWMEAKGLLMSLLINHLRLPTDMPGYLEVPCGHRQNRVQPPWGSQHTRRQKALVACPEIPMETMIESNRLLQTRLLPAVLQW